MSRAVLPPTSPPTLTLTLPPRRGVPPPPKKKKNSQQEATAFAPATVANLGPGFDWLGVAVGPAPGAPEAEAASSGDWVTARAMPSLQPGEVVIEDIVGDGGRLGRDPATNCVGIAAKETMRLLGAAPSCGVALRLKKGLPLGSGLGSSAASAAAAAWAVNALFGRPLSKDQLVLAGLASEAAVSGYHADNVAPALMGGFVLVRSCDPLALTRLPFGGAAEAMARAAAAAAGAGTAMAMEMEAGSGESSSSSSSDSSDDDDDDDDGPKKEEDKERRRREADQAAAKKKKKKGKHSSSSAPPPLYFVLVNPVFEAPTAKMRAALPQDVPFKSLVHNSTHGGALVAAILAGDAAALGLCLDSGDRVIEPARAPLIPGLAAVKEAAKEAGAYGCTISGAGPTAVAIVDCPDVGARVAEAMGRAFKAGGGLEVNSSRVAALDVEGARLVM
jgi:homoserine kinase